MNTPERAATGEANRLYWDTDTSVAEIAGRLGWSRRALYDAIEPLPTETPCPTCGTPLVYANRSARTSGTTTCHVCAAREKAGGSADTDALAQMGQAEARDQREFGYAVGGAALAGLALGAALAFLLVPRR
jgi:hypothetical protein